MIFVIVALTIFFDQITKFIVLKRLTLHSSLPVLKGIFHITLVENKGAAFGILKNQNTLFIGTALLAIVLILADLRKAKARKVSLYEFGLGLILAGAIGNLIDRLRWGYVVDFLDLRIWPVFNIADSAITIGAVMLGYCILVDKKGKTQRI